MFWRIVYFFLHAGCGHPSTSRFRLKWGIRVDGGMGRKGWVELDPLGARPGKPHAIRPNRLKITMADVIAGSAAGQAAYDTTGA